MTYDSKVSDDTRYAYAVGKVRVLERRLLKGADIERIVEPQDAQGALRILAEFSDYQEDAAKLESPSGFERILLSQLLRTYSLMRELSFDKWAIDLMLLRYDFLNIKSLIRSRYSKKEPAITALGSIGPKPLKEAILDGNFSTMKPWPAGSIKEALGIFEREKDPAALDTFLDKALYAYIVKEFARLPFIAGYFKLSSSLDYAKAAKYLPFGIEPLFGYIVAKENEVSLLRLIIIAKLYGEPEQAIRQRLGGTYV